MSRISIVTTSLNHAAFLGEALESVRSQRYPNLEHIVLDGASTDSTVPLLQTLTGPAWQHLNWTSQPDGGQTQAMNKGLRQATGDIVGWLNADDRYRPGCLQTVSNFFAGNPSIDILYGDYTLIDQRGKHLRIRREIEFSRFVLLYHRVLYIPTTSTFVRRRIFDENNWLDESLQYAMDHEFFVRLASRGYRFQHLPAILADFRMHPDSKTGRMPARQLAESRMAMHKHSTVALTSPITRSLCLGTLQAAAGFARYTEKFLRGYYLPEFIHPLR